MAGKKRKKAKKPVKRIKKRIQSLKKKTLKKRLKTKRRKPIRKPRIISSGRRRTGKKPGIKPKRRIKRVSTRKKSPKKQPASRAPQPAAQPYNPAILPETRKAPVTKTVKAVTSAEKSTSAVSNPKTRGPLNAALIASAVIAAVVGVFAVLYFLNNNKPGEIYAGLMPVSYTDTTGKLQDMSKKYYEAITDAAGRSGLKKEEKDFYNSHFISLYSSAGAKSCTGMTAQDCARAWKKHGLPEINLPAGKNVAALGLVNEKNSAKISWSYPGKAGMKTGRKWLSAGGRADKKKTDSFISAANAYIADPRIRQQAIDFYTGPAVVIDAAGDIAPYYLYYLSYIIVSGSYPADKGVMPAYPPFAEGDPADFLGMEQMFKVFEKKAETLDGINALIETAAGKKLDAVAAEKIRKASAEISSIAAALDSETTQKFLSTALYASLPAQQWAKMENSKVKRPWFETTYDEDLAQVKVKRYLNGLKSAKSMTDSEKKLVAAAALILYKTSRCMGTFTWSKSTLAYSENYRLAHAILMHFINSYDAALCKKLGDELDRYYAGRYYGTVLR
jgi:hypothetical protein